MNISKFFQLKPNVFLFKYAPFNFSTRYLRFLGKLYYIANRKERDQIKRNIMTVFESEDKARVIIKKAFDGIFSHYSEKLIMAYRNIAHLKEEVRGVLEYSGLEYLDKAMNNGGVVLVTGHFGAVEFLPLALHLRNYPVTIMVSFQTEQLKKTTVKRANEGNVEIIDCRTDNVIQKSLDAMRRGRILLTECDEVDAWKIRQNQTMQAFGGEILLDRSLDVLCKRTGATPLLALMMRTEKGYRLNIVPVEKEHNYSLGEDILKTFESFVMKFPDQWYQWKKFHKMRPEVA